MNKYLVKLRHLTFRRAVNKLISLVREIPVTISLSNTEKINTQLYEETLVAAGKMNGRTESSYYDKCDLTVGIITDEFMYNYYKDAVGLVTVTPDNYRELIDNKMIDCLLYVSCWHGMEGDEWYGEINHGMIPRVFSYANDHDIVTFFQSIEDPISYQRFLPIAKASNFIFTSCRELVEKYREDTRNDNVFVLEYGVNPLFHNPIGINTDRNDNTVFFAGSWMDIYKNRCADMRTVFDGVIESDHNLMIADRNVEVKLPGYKYPRAYQRFTVPPIEHSLLQQVHKLFDFNININTVQDSSTMCAMRVYELQALGCMILSNYALAVSENFPGLFIINNKEEAGHIISGYAQDELDRMRADNLRNVMSDCTVYDRLNFIFKKSGLPKRFAQKTVAVLCRGKSAEIIEMFNKQTYEKKILCTADELENAEFDYIAFWDEKNTYERDYITDLVNGFKFSDCAFVTKDTDCPGKEYDLVTGPADPGKSMVQREACDTFMTELGPLQGNGLKIDRFQINEVKKISNEKKELAVIVPVYNNGEYLYGRCFRSLLRSSIFDRMNIYLVDDGSTDQATLDIVDDLSRRYDNVIPFYFNDGGSGSAARPRNKGVQLASEKYVTYLDPDNEAISDGYARLLQKIKEKDCDMAFGSIYTRTDKTISKLGFLFKDTYISNPRECLIKENLRPQSVQGCVIKRQFILDNDITNVEGAYGEDSLFFQELMINAKSAYYLNLPIHIYYAERSGSSVNALDTSFFEKSLILEKEQVRRFARYGILDEYINRRLDYFVINWYLDKLFLVDREEQKECLDMIGQITELYGKDVNEYIGRTDNK